MKATQFNVTKRNGSKEPFNIEKIHRLLEWASEGLDDVSYSDVELQSHIQFYEGIPTKDIHKILTQTAANMITEDKPDYQYLAARTEMFNLRKEVHGQFNPIPYYDFIHKMVNIGKYTPELLETYSKEEIDYLDTIIDHNRDMNFTYAAIGQLIGKYLIKDKVSGQIYETPQFLYMSLSMTMFIEEKDPVKRLKYVVDYYNLISNFEISLPTPIMSGLRTRSKQFSSCVLIEAADSLDSINAVSSAIVKYISQKAGIGIGGSAIRAVGSKIRNGEAEHTGVIPFYKHFQTAVKSCSQGGVRGGSATLYYPFWHLEVENLLVLKNNKGTEDNRIRKLDYGFQVNAFFWNKVVKKQEVALFSPDQVPDLYDAFYGKSIKKFVEIYEKYEKDPNVRKKFVSAFDLANLFINERVATGRIYPHFVDNTNLRTPFKAPIRQSNLCAEIALPTVPMEYHNDPKGEIALCTLSAFNLGLLPVLDLENDDVLRKQLYDFFSDRARMAVRGLDNLLSYQDYLMDAAKLSTEKYRNLGFGVVNYAYLLAKNGKLYSNESAIKLTHHVFEVMQYCLMQASVELAKEKGACGAFNDLIYADGKLLIDNINPNVKKLLKRNNADYLLMDWEALREDIKKYGIRNATLSALMPSETSSQIINATNGIEPPRDFVSVKGSKDGYLKQVVYDIKNVKWDYELLWDQKSPEGYLKLVAVMQTHIDQAISTNTTYNPKYFANGKVTFNRLLSDMIFLQNYGLKTAYYNNINDRVDDDCDSCKI